MLHFTRSLFVLLLVSMSAFTALPEVAELPGPLVLTAGKPSKGKDAASAFLELAGKDKAKIVMIADGEEKLEELLKAFRDQKVDSIRIVTAIGAKREKSFEEATGIWVWPEVAGIEKELKKLQSRGVVIGGGPELLKVGLLPGFATQAEAGAIGLTFEDGAGIVARGRNLRVIGDKTITIRIAKGAGKPPAIQEAKAGSILDTFQLRRAALNRASVDPFPPAKPNEPVVEKGTLVIVGGGGTTPKIMDTFLAAAGGKDALIVVIPTTEKDGPGDAAYLKKFGATNVKVLFTKDHKIANDPAFSEMLTKAGGVWFGGGRQWNFVDSFEGTLVEKRFHEVLARGGAIGGSSAGASIQSEFMPRGHPLGNTVMAAEGYEKGFGFLPGCAVDQHFFARERRDDMTGLMKLYPQYLGIGIDEATAIVVKGSTAEVMGRSRVAFYDTKKKSELQYEWDRSGRLVWFEKDYEELREGDKYDLKKREKIK